MNLKRTVNSNGSQSCANTISCAITCHCLAIQLQRLPELQIRKQNATVCLKSRRSTAKKNSEIKFPEHGDLFFSVVGRIWWVFAISLSLHKRSFSQVFNSCLAKTLKTGTYQHQVGWIWHH